MAVLASLAAPPYQPARGARSNGRVLMFVAYNEVWWAEYKVVYQALQAQGYSVDVRSSASGVAHSYGDNISAVPGAPSSYAAFRTLFADDFGSPWDAAWDAPQDIPLGGRIQDVTSMDGYDALVIPGGTGARAYRYDGSYSALGPPDHVTSTQEVQAAAERLNSLIVQALQDGKPVGAECHAAPIAAFARTPNTAGQGPGGLGRSVLAGHFATGYPGGDGDTAASYASLNVTYLSTEKVVLDGPAAADFDGNPNGRGMIVTGADWYPQTAAYFARTLLTMLATYPTPSQRTRQIKVLVYGGDEPANYPPQQPARYTDFVALLNDPSDDLNIEATGATSDSLTLADLQAYDVLVYFRHNRIPQASQDAIRAYVDGGGGLVALHHTIYNEGDAKGTLIDLVGGELPNGVALNSETGLVYQGQSNHLIDVDLGNFVSSYGTLLLSGQPTQTVEYSSPLGLPNPNVDGNGNRGYYGFSIPAPDELYLANHFNAGVSFGRGVNQIDRIFANDHYVAGSPNPNNGHYDAWGWTRRYDGDSDGKIGRIVYLQPGETNDRTLSTPSYRQAIKNAVVWSAIREGPTIQSKVYLPLTIR